MNYIKKTGKALAHIQNAIDEGVKFSFRAISYYSNKKSKSQKQQSKPVKYLSKFFKGVGDLGQSYYDEYENIKKKKDS